MARLAPALLLATGCAAGRADVPGAVEVFVADPGAGVVWRADADGWAPVVDASTPGAHPAFDPAALAQDAAGTLLVADFATGAVSAWVDGALVPRFENPADPEAVRIEEPCGMVPTGSGLAVLGNDTENVAFLDAAGGVRGELGPAALLGGAHGLAALPDGTLLVASSPAAPGAETLRVWDPDLGAPVRAFGAGLEVPVDVVALPDGTVAVADWATGVVSRLDPADGADLGPLAEGLDRPVAVALLGDDVLVLAQDGLWSAGAGVRVAAAPGLVFPRDLHVR